MPPNRADVDLEQLTFQELTALPERQFRIVVTADMRKDASNERIRDHVPPWITEALRGPLAARRLALLKTMLANVDGQLELKANAFELARAEGRDTDEVVATYHRECAGPMRFRSALLEAIPEAEYLVSDRIGRLEQAIRAHHRAIEADTELEPSAADLELWAALTTST